MPRKAEDKRRSSSRDHEEYVKSAAWAWYQHGGGAPSKLLRESEAQNRQNSASTTPRPSRFKVEANRLPTSPSVSTRPKNLDGLHKSTVGGFLTFEPHEGEDVGDSSLLDHYEIVELSRHLERSLSISVKKSAAEKSWIERGLSADLVHTPAVDVVDKSPKKKVCKAPKTSVVRRWCTPAMCSVTDVVIPHMAENQSPVGSPSRLRRRPGSKNSDLNLSGRFHGVRQRLQEALVLPPVNSPPHRESKMASSARRHSLESSHKR